MRERAESAQKTATTVSADGAAARRQRPGDVFFTFESSAKLSAQTLAAWHAAYRPLATWADPFRGLEQPIGAVQRRWRQLVDRLHRAGWSPVVRPLDWQRYRNCPPAHLPTEHLGRLLLRCHCRLCPFCCAERAGDWYGTLRGALYETPDARKPHPLEVWSVIAPRASCALGEVFNAFGPRAKGGRSRRRGILGGIYNYRVIAPKGGGDRVLVGRDAILLLEAGRTIKPGGGLRWKKHTTNRAGLVAAVRRVLTLPKSWYEAEPALVRLYLEKMHHRQLTTSFGILRRGQELAPTTLRGEDYAKAKV